MVDLEDTSTADTEQRLTELGMALPPPPTPFGNYVEAVRIGRLGAELTVDEGRRAAETATLSALAAIRAELGSLDRVTAVAKLGVYIATSDDFREHPQVADGASDLLAKVFGPEMLSGRIVLGVASLPLGLPVKIEPLVEVAD
ncbi:RidA family protein [Ensifer adhaerens]|uniref:RidA family protein n=1 Tax=Ensifer adhaerens TaxID=106592 RepID=UPI000CF14BD5|nr:RidA family protein [Ensifer adhaerens]